MIKKSYKIVGVYEESNNIIVAMKDVYGSVIVITEKKRDKGELLKYK